MTAIELVVLDMAGTTVLDDGLVERAFATAFDEHGIATAEDARDRAMERVRATMGQSKIVVFTEFAGDPKLGAAANVTFERAYADLIAAGEAQPVPGALETIRELRAAGLAVVFTTGFSRETQDVLLGALGWSDVANLALTPADAGGRGRPHPDLNLTALIRTRAASVQSMVVVGDTTSDVLSGVRAGAGRSVGVLTGAHDEAVLRDAGATDVLADVTALPELLRIRG
jgi:phosphoglycolate phosphatase